MRMGGTQFHAWALLVVASCIAPMCTAQSSPPTEIYTTASVQSNGQINLGCSANIKRTILIDNPLIRSISTTWSATGLASGGGTIWIGPFIRFPPYYYYAAPPNIGGFIGGLSNNVRGSMWGTGTIDLSSSYYVMEFTVSCDYRPNTVLENPERTPANGPTGSLYVNMVGTCVTGATMVNNECRFCCPAGLYNTVSGTKDCAGCPVNSYSTGCAMNAACTACPTYHISPVNTTSLAGCAINCPVGMYITGATCTQCPAGTYSDVVNASTNATCQMCPTGKYSAAGSRNCSDCPAGTYADVGGTKSAAACTSCPAGTSSSALGATSIDTCVSCSPGSSAAARSPSCALCAAGFYEELSGQGSCDPCPGGTYSSAVGSDTSSTCSICPAGSFSSTNSTSCRPCPAGRYENETGSAVCDACPAGTASPVVGALNDTVCSTCPAGTYSIAGSGVCTSCPAGTYNEFPEMSSCTPCEAGFFSSALGATSNATCTLCAPGTYSGKGSQSCTACPVGNYSANSGQGSCTPCQSGWTTVSTRSNSSWQCRLVWEPPVTNVTLGFYHTCSLMSTGSVKCWGKNTNYRLGFAATASNSWGDVPGEMGNFLPSANLGTGMTAKQIGAGSEFSCALLNNNQIRCWGSNSYGQLGTENVVAGNLGDSAPLAALGAGRTATQVAPGSSHVCAILDNGLVKCWGDNSCGQLGQGNTLTRGDGANEMGDNLPYTTLGTGRTVTQIVSGEGFSCALMDDGYVKCWGCGLYGQIGKQITTTLGDNTGEMGDSLSNINLGNSGYTTAKYISTGPIAYHVCAILSTNLVKCWGMNNFGQLGIGTTVNMGNQANSMGDSLPVANMGTGRTARMVSVGNTHSCAVLDNGQVKCWGGNNYGQLGYGDTTQRGSSSNQMGDYLPFVNLGTGRTAISVHAEIDRTCAVLDNQKVKCWGRNAEATLGLGLSTTVVIGDAANEMGDNLPYVSLGTQLCENCGAGQYKPTICGTCQSCPVGTFSSAINALSCSKCPAGMYSDVAGALTNETCQTCPAGTYSAEGSSSCTPCVVGTYSAIEGAVSNATCTKCAAGRASNILGANTSETCGICPAGSFSLEGSATCTLCRPGTYSTQQGGTTCTLCDAGYASAATGASDLATCMTCPAGTYAPAGSAVCVACPAGTYSESEAATSNATCLKCSVGYASNVAGASSPSTCTICPSGTYADTQGSAVCTPCPFGTYLASEGATTQSSCQACPAGTASLVLGASSSDTCVACPQYTSAPAAGSALCTPFLQVDAGELHTCSKLSNGKAYCWGSGDWGRLGNSANQGTLGPSPVSQGNNTVVQISSGSVNTCAVLDSGRVVCWGLGTSGRLGNGGTASVNTPVFVTGITNAVQVSTGQAHACCLLRTGYVMCWGNGANGRLGNNNTANQNTPVNVLGISNAVQISSGSEHSCAVLSTGSVVCWGRGDSGQLGDALLSLTASIPVAVSGITNALHVKAGVVHSCTVLRTGDVRCWGSGSYGRLGDAGTSQRTTPVTVTGITNAVQVSVGTDHTCATLSTGIVRCWGYGSNGQLGHGSSPATQTTPVNVTGITNALQVSAGGAHTCAVLSSGSVMCWGLATSGQLGVSYTLTSTSVPIAVVLPSANYLDAPGPVMNMSSGQSSMSVCAITFDGRLKCWGYALNGVLGTGATADVGSSVNQMGGFLMYTNVGTGRSVVQVSGSHTHRCAVLENGQLKCWGSNFKGELGQGHLNALGDGSGEMGDFLPAVNLGTGQSVVQVSAARNTNDNYCFTCALLGTGNVKCFGLNSNGQLGKGDTVDVGGSAGQMGDSLLPVQLGSGGTARMISTGSGFVCAVMDNRQIKCWGNNAYGNLGLGDKANRGNAANQMGDNLPYVQLGTGITALKVECGANFVCALLNGGGVKCWGRNLQGSLGLGHANDMGDNANEMGDNLPYVQIGTGRVAKDLFVGDMHACVILDNNLVKCWGSAGSGRIGYGSSTAHVGDQVNEMGDFLPYVNIGAGRTALHMSLTYASTCALLDNYALRCWGSNSVGQLGIGNTDTIGDAIAEMGDALVSVNIGEAAPIATPCSTGYYRIVEGNTCAICPAGTYNTDPRALSCTPCPRGSYANASGTAACTLCPAGYASFVIGASSDSTCGICPAGQFSPVAGSANCTICPAAQYSVDPGSTSCQLCSAGWETALAGSDSPDDCTICPAGSYSSAGTQCVKCVAGTYSEQQGATSNATCLACQPGTASNVVGAGSASTCATCPTATYASSAGTAVCTPCPMGTYSTSQGLTSVAQCQACPAGTASTVLGATSSSVCAACLSNTTYSIEGSPVCIPRAEISPGNAHTCAKDLKNKPYCWGSGTVGQLGQKGTGTLLTPVPVFNLSLVARISSGNAHTCAVLITGRVMCWGQGTQGQLGNGLATTSNVATQVLVVTDAFQTSCGGEHTCAVLQSGRIMCWGSAGVGMLGNGGSTVQQNTPVFVSGISNAVQVSVGVSHSCAVLATGSAICWGEGMNGQLGNGQTARYTVPVAVSGITNAIHVTAGNQHTCALLATGSIMCWGVGTNGQLGNGGTAQQNTPVAVSGITNAVHISADNALHTCAVLSTGSVRCWGHSAQGQLGNGGTTQQNSPVSVTGITNAVRVTVRLSHSCAVLTTGDFTCWGRGMEGQLGNGGTSQQLTPTPVVMPPSNYVEPGPIMEVISGMGGFYCALTFDNRMKCWGSGTGGQLGIGTSADMGDSGNEMGNYLQYVNPGTGLNIVQAVIGAGFTCVLLNIANVKCWGGSAQGQLGYGSTSALTSPPLQTVNLGTGRTVKRISSSYLHTCAILDNDLLKCWGYNANAQLGLGDVNNRGGQANQMGDSLPYVNLGTGRTVKMVSTGSDHTCAILDNNQLKCWGRGDLCQLGIGKYTTNFPGGAANTMGDSLPSVNLGTGRYAVSVHAGDRTTCVLLDNNLVKCFGYNWDGQAGYGTNTDVGCSISGMGDALPYVNLGTGRSVKRIRIGLSNVCAILDNDRIKCWGNNAYGTLGTGNTVKLGDGPNEMGDNLPYADIGTARVPRDVAVGEYAVCVLLQSYGTFPQEVKCWGYNSNGRLGIGNTNNIGDGPNEMGDALVSVDIGLAMVQPVECPAGSYRIAESNTCAFCPVGTTSLNGSSSCTNCSIGSYAPVAGSASCTACPANYNTTRPGSTACDPLNSNCTAGYFGLPGSSNCTICPAGTFSLAQAVDCTPCPRTSYSTSPGSTNCTRCAVPTHATLVPFAKSARDCSPAVERPQGGSRSCNAGTFSVNDTHCVQCLPGTASAAVGASSLDTCATCAAGEKIFPLVFPSDCTRVFTCPCAWGCRRVRTPPFFACCQKRGLVL